MPLKITINKQKNKIFFLNIYILGLYFYKIVILYIY